jgi:hypothetical protein
LIINPYAVLPLAIPFETLQFVPWRNSQGTERNDSIQLIQFSPSYLPIAFRAGSARFLRIDAVKNIVRSRVVKRSDHAPASKANFLFIQSIMDIVIHVNKKGFKKVVDGQPPIWL